VRSPSWFAPLAFAACCLIWGSTWLAIKVGYEGTSALTAAGLRFFLAAIILTVAGAALRSKFPLKGPPLHLAVTVGVLLFTFDYGLIYWGEQFLESGLTAVLFATLPIQTALLANAFIPAERLTRRRAAGVALGFVGVLVIFNQSLTFDSSRLAPMVAIVLAATFASISSVTTKIHGHSADVVGLNAVAMMIGALLLFLGAAVLGEPLVIPTSSTALFAIAYLAILGSVVTFLLYFWLLKTWQATTLSFIAVIIPVIALVLGFWYRGEVVGPAVLTGGAMIICGIYLVSTAGAKVGSPVGAGK
jgi:drug/metabolite transporter (DMT)-like permease